MAAAAPGLTANQAAYRPAQSGYDSQFQFVPNLT